LTIRVGVNARHLSVREMRGTTRYTLSLLRELARTGAVEVVLFSDRPVHPMFHGYFPFEEVCFTSPREILWEQWELPRRLRQGRIEVFHAPYNRGLPWRRVCRYVLTIHDIIENMPALLPPRRLKSRLRQYYADVASVRAADAILTVSEHSKRDICRYWRVSPDRVIVTREACDSRFYDPVDPTTIAEMRRRLSLPPRYLLYLGGFDRKKNVGGLLRGYALTSAAEVPDLVLAGEKKWDFPAMESLARALGCNERVIFTDTVHEADLPALYQGALAFVYPSLYEGFGLQLVEAMASGVPVVASNRTSLPEILGGAGLLFDPERPEEIAERLRRVSLDAELRERLRRAGAARAAEFSWARMAAETLQVYRRVLAA
jgi:glycosyltransferase involved in cell wall biosynthesis